MHVGYILKKAVNCFCPLGKVVCFFFLFCFSAADLYLLIVDDLDFFFGGSDSVDNALRLLDGFWLAAGGNAEFWLAAGGNAEIWLVLSDSTPPAGTANKRMLLLVVTNKQVGKNPVFLNPSGGLFQ